MERKELLRGMDLNMWEMFRDISRLCRGGELFETPHFWMAYSPRGTPFHNMVMIRDGADAESVFAAARRFYGERGAMCSFWTRAHADAEFEGELRRRGFADFTSMPGMALLADPGTKCEPPGLDIRPVADDRGRHDYMRITAEAYAIYGAPRAYAEDAFASLESVRDTHIRAFIGYVNGEAAAGATLYFTHGIAGVGWVGTLPEHRKKRYAEALTWAVVREGFKRGATYANLQASPMGRPVYERMGFETITEYRVLVGSY
jgi:GNAT superfamily N-acetyltransferase